MNIPFDWVLVKPKPTNKLLLGGKEFYLDTRFEETKNAPSCGEVIAVPDKLRFSMVEGQTTLEYDTDIDIKIGDMVIFHYLTEENAQMDGRIMEDGNILIRYDSLFIAKRGDEVICLNDYIIVEPESAVIKTNLEIPDVVSKQKAKQVGIVKYAGTPVRAYRFFPDDYPDPSLQVGDRVVFSHYNAVPLQQYAEIHGELSKGILYKMQRRDVDAIINQEAEVALF